MANKKITFTYDGKKYTLEFCRSSVRQMESAGFDIRSAESKPETFREDLFAGSFLMHHKSTAANRELTEEIFDSFKNRSELLSTLIGMYQDVILSGFDEPEEDQGNIEWGVQ